MTTMANLRRSTSARTRTVVAALPADHPFATATLSAAVNGKGSRVDVRRYQRRALALATKETAR